MAIIGTRGYPSFYGGFETAVRHLAPYLAARGWEVTVYGRPGSTTEDPDFNHQGISTITTRGINSRSLSTLSFGATASLDAFRRNPDVALVMNVANGFFLPILRTRGIPSAVNVDGIEWIRAKWGRLAKSIFRTGAKLTAKYAATLIFDARAIEKFWQNTFGAKGVFIPYGGQELEELPIEPGLIHREYILYVARFVPENSTKEFFEAARRLAEKHKVVIVGSDGFDGELDREAERLNEIDNITWLGHVRNDQRLHSLWQHCGAYFHGHSVGGTNPALVQAMFSGAPIVARDTVYNREVLTSTATFTEAQPAAISAAIESTMRNKASMEQQAATNLARGKQAYDWDRICSQYENVLIELIAGRKR
ncbi:glycosyltransferase [Curtobacterium sp. UCD-KPL2560]|uniref:glycosyltransferase n=1 Tax=Curtobacterium sp. UCD-KPL2560 TaxID=1885315 RepID=UPI001C0ADB71|nr:glycosyltransferase [Curtobacterium sp. UCD-KPL2560]